LPDVASRCRRDEAKKAAEFGQARILVLDDALQSADATIRQGVMSYVLDELKDWQLIIAGHDRAWQEQLREQFLQAGQVSVQLGRVKRPLLVTITCASPAAGKNGRSTSRSTALSKTSSRRSPCASSQCRTPAASTRASSPAVPTPAATAATSRQPSTTRRRAHATAT
jgi:hypothetical protein